MVLGGIPEVLSVEEKLAPSAWEDAGGGGGVGGAQDLKGKNLDRDVALSSRDWSSQVGWEATQENRHQPGSPQWHCDTHALHLRSPCPGTGWGSEHWLAGAPLEISGEDEKPPWIPCSRNRSWCIVKALDESQWITYE